jgi:hypothetical protein
MYDLGFVYDPGNYVINAEVIQRKGASSAILDVTAYSLMGGLYLGSWTPYIAYARAHFDDDFSKITVLRSTLARTFEQSSLTLGLRYDLMKNVALKAQWDRVRKPASAPNEYIAGTFVFPQGTSLNNWVSNTQRINITTLALDFVF